MRIENTILERPQDMWMRVSLGIHGNDLTKAFDTVHRTLLWQLLSKFGCPPNFIRVLAALHDGMNATVVAGGKKSAPFQVTVGVKQGCVLAPVIFSLFTTAVILLLYNNINAEELGVPLNYWLDGNLFNLARLRARTRTSTKAIVELQYADDAGFVSHTAQGLQPILDHVCTEKNRSVTPAHRP